MKLQATTGQQELPVVFYVQVARAHTILRRLSLFFFAPPFVIDTRAKQISIRPLGDAIYLQLVPRPLHRRPIAVSRIKNRKIRYLTRFFLYLSIDLFLARK